MKLINVLFANLICLPVLAQRDFQLTEQRNFWLTSGNAAALTTYGDSTIAYGAVRYSYDGGNLRPLTEGRRQHTYGGEVQSYCRLSERVVAYGKITYTNRTGTEMSGSMLYPTAELLPFDLVDDSLGNAGDKQAELFRLNGAVGWNVWRGLSVGARVDYTAGDYAKHRDLRHTNTLMNLDTRVNVFYSLSDDAAVGAGFLYRRNTETMAFKAYGTTDRVFKTLIDYANRVGTVETFGSDGFTDDTQEQPLFTEYAGVTAQGSWHGLYADMAYRHRTGYYGRQSQYTVSHARHSGDDVSLSLRYQLPSTAGRLVWIDATVNTEKLTAERNNYRRVTATENTSVKYYEYYEPTKMSDKTQTYGTAAVTGYWKPAGDIYLFRLHAGMDYWYRRQTAYLYPTQLTAHSHAITPFANARRGFLFSNSGLMTVQLGYAMTFGSTKQLAAQAAVTYEMPVSGTTVRPHISLSYGFRTGLDDATKGLSRNTLAVSAGCTF